MRWKGNAGGGPLWALVRYLRFKWHLDQTLGNWYLFVEPIHLIKNLLTVKYLLNVVTYFIVIIFRSVPCESLFWRIGQKALVMTLWTQGGGCPKNFGNHWFRWNVMLSWLEKWENNRAMEITLFDLINTLELIVWHVAPFARQRPHVSTATRQYSNNGRDVFYDVRAEMY
jgi:hypothetical protein